MVDFFGFETIPSAPLRESPQPFSPEAKGLLKVEDVAERLAVQKGYVYDLIRRGELPSVRFGKNVRVEQETLSKWIAQRREPALTPLSTSRRLGSNEGRRSPTTPSAARAHPATACRQARRNQKHRLPMGKGPDGNPRTVRSAAPSTGQDGRQRKA